MSNGNHVSIVGNLTRDPGVAIHADRTGHGQLRRGGQPALAESADAGMGGSHLLLRRGVLGPARRKRRPVPLEGLTSVGERAPRPAQLGDGRARAALEDRDHRGRGRAEPALGDSRHHPQRATQRPTAPWEQRSIRAVVPAAP